MGICVCLIRKNNFFLLPVLHLGLISEKGLRSLSSAPHRLPLPSQVSQALRGNEVTVWQKHPYFMPKDAEPSMRQAYCMHVVQQNGDGSYTLPAKSPSPICQHWDLWGMSEVNTQTLAFSSNAMWRYPLSRNATFYCPSATAPIPLSLNLHLRLICFCCTSSDLLYPVLLWPQTFIEISQPGGNMSWWWVQFQGEWSLATNLTG